MVRAAYWLTVASCQLLHYLLTFSIAMDFFSIYSWDIADIHWLCPQFLTLVAWFFSYIFRLFFSIFLIFFLSFFFFSPYSLIFSLFIRINLNICCICTYHLAHINCWHYHIITEKLKKKTYVPYFFTIEITWNKKNLITRGYLISKIFTAKYRKYGFFFLNFHLNLLTTNFTENYSEKWW